MSTLKRIKDNLRVDWNIRVFTPIIFICILGIPLMVTYIITQNSEEVTLFLISALCIILCSILHSEDTGLLSIACSFISFALLVIGMGDVSITEFHGGYFFLWAAITPIIGLIIDSVLSEKIET